MDRANKSINSQQMGAPSSLQKEFGPGLDNKKPLHLNDIKFVEISSKGSAQLTFNSLPAV